MTDETEIPEQEEPEEVEFELPEEPLHCPDGSLDCIGGRFEFMAYWLGRLGVEPEGSAMTFMEGGAVAILHPHTGKWLTPEQIAKLAEPTGNVRRIQ